ncbi:hypothetical protein FN846DRAFT_28858 [Sphaerosporella brunnea]|uniref:Uncharacterized protein n=1 Tax=Sphaerosporella brunnea TaxID=1250544 RepID=A0A5J5EUL6_9PEZI|nr:hypothetical protein FN846DRAFT_28858 [Sphaerosporella brunnea]
MRLLRMTIHNLARLGLTYFLQQQHSAKQNASPFGLARSEKELARSLDVVLLLLEWTDSPISLTHYSPVIGETPFCCDDDMYLISKGERFRVCTVLARFTDCDYSNTHAAQALPRNISYTHSCLSISGTRHGEKKKKKKKNCCCTVQDCIMLRIRGRRVAVCAFRQKRPRKASQPARQLPTTAMDVAAFVRPSSRGHPPPSPLQVLELDPRRRRYGIGRGVGRLNGSQSSARVVGDAAVPTGWWWHGKKALFCATRLGRGGLISTPSIPIRCLLFPCTETEKKSCYFVCRHGI